MKDKIKGKNWIYRILALFIAILLWVFVVFEINPDMEAKIKNINVIITDTEQLVSNGLTIVSGGNKTMSVRVRGKRDKLILLEADKFRVTASAAQISEPGTHTLSCDILVNVDGVTVLSKTPSQITVVVDRVSAKTVPVSMQFKGSLSNGYILDSYNISPDAIVVKGPRSQLEKIDKAILTYNYSEMTKSFSSTLSYKLVDADNKEIDMTELTVDTPAVVMSAVLKMKKAVPFTVDLISVGVFTDSIVDCTIDPGIITIIGDPDIVREINQINLGSINLMDSLVNRENSLIYQVVLPNGISSEEHVDSVTVTLSTPRHSFFDIDIPVSEFVLLDGYEYLRNEKITVRIFGANDIVNAVKSSDFTVAPAKVGAVSSNGTANIELSVSCNDPAVTVVGKYSVNAKPVIVQ